MKTITVMGAGVTGVATAWYLCQAGFDVTVIDRKPAAALETSYANGGQISVCHATPWANPATPIKALKWLFQADAPLLYHLNANLEQWRFLARFLGECTPAKTDANLVQMVNLGLYSRSALKTLMNEISIDFEQRLSGIMHFYTSAKEYQSAIAPTQRMQELGCHRTLISPNEAVGIEPALSALGNHLVGATYTHQDLSGNAYLFTQALAKHCADNGVKFLYDTDIVKLHRQGQHITHISVQNSTNAHTPIVHHHADAFVVCLASYGKRLLDPIGVDLPIFPAKGYSATYKVLGGSRVPQVSLIDDEYKLVMSRFSSSDEGGRDVLRVAGTAEFDGYNTALSPVRCLAITRRVKALFGNALDYSEPNYWTGQRPMTPSNVPLIGKAHLGKVRHGSVASACSTFDNLWLNTGHGTLGFTHSCGSAKALSLLIQGVDTGLDFAFVGA
ncbi:MAG: D-amino acid dehydrogenase [Moraxella sp.]|nr:D-amino acid dehydrogenase [Moraxella sp.]